MPAAADREARAIWRLEHADSPVTIQSDQGYTVTDSTGHTIATQLSLDALRTLVDKFYGLV